MRSLLLHIGHGKTGSSYLQAAFRTGRARLAEAGVAYPRGADDFATDPSKITSGNAQALLVSPAALRERLTAAADEADGRSQLWSSEYLFPAIERGEAVAALPEVARDLGFETVRVLLFVRDPLGHAASSWQQGVKRHGSTESLEDAFAAFDFPERVAAVLDRLEAVGAETTVRNYSRCRGRLLSEVAAWLGIPETALPPPGVERVNRSLTRGELLLQREFNRVLGQSGRLFADPLCERLPDVPADDMRPPLAVQEATWERLRPVIERINGRVAEDHRYRADLRPPPEEAAATFSQDQLRVIGESLGEEIARLRRERERLRAILADPAAHLGARRLGRAFVGRLGRRLRRRLGGPT